MNNSTRKPKRILLVCPYPEGVAPGQRLKYEQYLEYLKNQGYSIKICSFVNLRFWSILYQPGHFSEKVFWTLLGVVQRMLLLPTLPFYDGIFIFHSVAPLGPALLERIYAWLNPRMVYDIDDMIHLAHSSQANRFTKWLKGSSRITHLMKKARYVITCTPALDAFARQYNPNTTDISSTINTTTYEPVNPYENQPNQPITLGWSGSHSTEKYLSILTNVLQEISKQRKIRLLVIGSGKFTMPGVDVQSIAWKSATEVADLQKIDIGLYPLPDDPWVYGKSGLKALQYMALGIPTIATAIGTNFRVIESGQSGLLVKTEEEWINALLKLIDQPAERRRLGQAGRQRVENYYSIEANKDVYLAIFDKVYVAPAGWPRPEGLSLITPLEKAGLTLPVIGNQAENQA